MMGCYSIIYIFAEAAPSTSSSTSTGVAQRRRKGVRLILKKGQRLQTEGFPPNGTPAEQSVKGGSLFLFKQNRCVL
jgi:hypothetical protein